MSKRVTLAAVLLVFGVALMHTLGHAVPDCGLPPPAGMAAHRPAAPLLASALAERFAPPRLASAGPAPVHRYGMDPSVVCLAILAALGALVALLALARASRSARGPTPRSPVPSARPRGPPPDAVGRQLAALSVLRV